MATTRAEARRVRPPLLQRLYRNMGSWGKLARAMEVKDNYPTRWRRSGYIPETYALAVDRLGLADEYGEITAYDVLLEAERVRARVLEDAQRALKAERQAARQAAS